MNVQRQPLPTFLQTFKLALTNARALPALQQRLAAQGYDAAKLDEGDALLTELQALDHAQLLAYDQKEAASSVASSSFEEADRLYTLHRNLARRGIKKSSIGYRALRLNERKATRRDRWEQQATHFYQSALNNPTILATLADYGQTAVRLQQGQAAISATVAHYAEQKNRKSQAEEATRQRDETWRNARDWFSAMLEVARYAVSDQPQLIEALRQVEASLSPVIIKTSPIMVNSQPDIVPNGNPPETILDS